MSQANITTDSYSDNNNNSNNNNNNNINNNNNNMRPLIASNSLSNIFYNNSNTAVAKNASNSKSTPRCLTPINNNIFSDNYFFPTSLMDPKSNIISNNDKLFLNDGYLYNNTNNSIFAYPSPDNISQNPSLISNEYTINTPADSDISLSPYRKNSLLSTTSTIGNDLTALDSDFTSDSVLNNLNNIPELPSNSDDLDLNLIDLMFKDKPLPSVNANDDVKIEVVDQNDATNISNLHVLLPSQQLDHHIHCRCHDHHDDFNNHNFSIKISPINDYDYYMEEISNSDSDINLNDEEEGEEGECECDGEEDEDEDEDEGAGDEGDEGDEEDEEEEEEEEDDDSSDYEDTLTNKQSPQSSRRRRRRNTLSSVPTSIDRRRSSIISKNIRKNSISNTVTTPNIKNEKQFKCDQCSSSFTRKTRLTEHINRVHLGKVYHFKCEQCGTRLSSKENLTRHSIVHTDKFKCKNCNRRFDRSYRFQRHLEKCNLLHS